MGWTSKFWDELEPITLICSWRKLLEHSGNEFQESKEKTENSGLVDLMKKIPGFKKATDDDVKEWMGQDEKNELLGDGEIVALVKEKDDEEPEEEEGKDDGKVKNITHSDRLNAIEGMLHYFEEQGVSALDILFLWHLHDEAAQRRNECERESSITKFFFKKD